MSIRYGYCNSCIKKLSADGYSVISTKIGKPVGQKFLSGFLSGGFLGGVKKLISSEPKKVECVCKECQQIYYEIDE